MLTVMNEMSMASIVATAGRNNLFSVLWLRCCGVPGGRDQVDAIDQTTDEQLLHGAGT